MWNFQLNSAKTSLLDTCGGSFRDTYDLPSKKVFLLSLRQHRWSKETIKFLGPTPPFFIFKNMWYPHMHWLPKNLFLLSLKHDELRNSTIKFLGPTPLILYLKPCDISGQIQQKGPFQKPAVAPFRDMHVCTDFQKICFYWA